MAIDGLFRTLCQDVRRFQSELEQAGEPLDDISRGRYVLCGFMDEAVLNTPWGGDSDYSHRTLLAEFHNEADAGEGNVGVEPTRCHISMRPARS